ncbi:hypothetical protein DdX_20494 [Ditylenchus destructor]|uniref:Uncharacterized protein n=1 Tax=Ditylenchus destructor TaxID=166010 RepID=A0AAD4QWB6_9BILA|nr:hypothetical protein DdX_20494 [Ditylenchus destructor]
MTKFNAFFLIDCVLTITIVNLFVTNAAANVIPNLDEDLKMLEGEVDTNTKQVETFIHSPDRNSSKLKEFDNLFEKFDEKLVLFSNELKTAFPLELGP